MHIFRSKKDWWLLAFIICMSGLLIQLLLTMQAKGTLLQYPLHSAVYILTIVVIWWPVWSTRYIVQDDMLSIKSLWLRWQIPLHAIQQIQPTDYSEVAPALSLKRLKITYMQADTQKYVLISPKKPEQFMQAIASHQAKSSAKSV
ncbi:MAG TPA: PH domain-containing protein [Acinetobacter lwoffii]|uniref:PH domain-containing protein n=1 Tax=Acinetobacter lwoffii TaxID=28090 RepID=A0A9D2URL1_ACILW|nr:PH domain-containing protein [Acinetobacter sp. 10FS3-1]MDM1782041.1 PH domain-containing protein [Acinetobacter indicus]QKQ68940.1 hypothetical protein E5Y90_01075 [Acinetobacter sp. 10FS3-1]HJF27232.1 PH domain-containing protein [Acinetobacter lwoffii]